MLLSLRLPLLRKNEIEYYGNKDDKGDGKVKSSLEKLPESFTFFCRLTTDSCLICFLFHIYSFTLSNEEMASRAKIQQKTECSKCYVFFYIFFALCIIKK